jgi:hypothetical protein
MNSASLAKSTMGSTWQNVACLSLPAFLYAPVFAHPSCTGHLLLPCLSQPVVSPCTSLCSPQLHWSSAVVSWLSMMGTATAAMIPRYAELQEHSVIMNSASLAKSIMGVFSSVKKHHKFLRLFSL